MDMHSSQEKYKEEEFSLEELNKIDLLLKESLLDDFEINIPADFADNVVEKVEKRRSIKESLLRHLIMCIGFVVILGFAVAFLFYFGLKEANILLEFAMNFKYPITFGILIITGIQLADSFLLSRTKDQLEE